MIWTGKNNRSRRESWGPGKEFGPSTCKGKSANYPSKYWFLIQVYVGLRNLIDIRRLKLMSFSSISLGPSAFRHEEFGEKVIVQRIIDKLITLTVRAYARAFSTEMDKHVMLVCL